MSLKLYIDKAGNRAWVQSPLAVQLDALQTVAYLYPAAAGGFIPGFAAVGQAVLPVGIGVRVA